MNLDSRISYANIITIGILLFSIAVSWGMMNNDILSIEDEIRQKADKDVVDVKFNYIQRDLSEIKEMISEIQKELK